MKKTIDIDKKPKKDGKFAHWSDKQRYQAVALYKMTGNMSAVHRSLGIPLNTLFVWRKSKWWSQYEADLLQEKRALTSANLQKLAKLASDVTADRLENGDWVFINGKLERKPVSAAVASRILEGSIKQERELEEHYARQTKSDSDIQVQERLKLLFDEMIKFKNEKKEKIVEAEWDQIEDKSTESEE